MLFKQKNRAFTLIELMVVVAIIGILTAIVLANLTQAKAKARDAKRVSDLGHIQLALEFYFDRCNVYPPNPLNADPTTGASCTSNGLTVKLNDYISQIPTDQGTAYQYAVNNSGTPTDYVLKANLETNNGVLIDSYHTDSLGVICSTVTTPPYPYCVLPR